MEAIVHESPSDAQVHRALDTLNRQTTAAIDHIGKMPTPQGDVNFYTGQTEDFTKVTAIRDESGGNRKVTVTSPHRANELSIDVDGGTITRRVVQPVGKDEGVNTGSYNMRTGIATQTHERGGSLESQTLSSNNEKVRRSIATRAILDTRKAVRQVEEDTPHLKAAKEARQAKRHAEIAAENAEREQSEPRLNRKLQNFVAEAYQEITALAPDETQGIYNRRIGATLLQAYDSVDGTDKRIVVDNSRKHERVIISTDSHTLVMKTGDHYLTVRTDSNKVTVVDRSDPDAPVEITHEVDAPVREILAASIFDKVTDVMDMAYRSQALGKLTEAQRAQIAPFIG